MEKSIKDVFIDELKDILSAENQIVKALPAMVRAAESPKLKEAFSHHLKETKGQLKRLNKIFTKLKEKKIAKFCKGAQGLIDECKEVLQGLEKSPVRDAALISKAQRIEHYEISAYGTARSLAKELGLKEIATLLQETLNEEANADKTLSKIATGGLFTSGINHNAHLIDEGIERPTVKAKKVLVKAKARVRRVTTRKPVKRRKITPAKKATQMAVAR